MTRKDINHPPPQIDTAMIMAAGLGTRMRPLTHHQPKPLIRVHGKPLLDYAVDELLTGGIKRFVVNVHYHAAMLEAHLQTLALPDLIISDERDDLLETGGGLKKARPYLGENPILCTNTDAIFCGSPAGTAVHQLRTAWHPSMETLLLLVPLEKTLGFDGQGDFHCDTEGRLIKARGEPAPYAYTGLQILHPSLLDNTPDGAFSTRLLWEKAAFNKTLYGVIFDGTWLHVGTPEGVEDAETFLKDQNGHYG